MSTSLPSPGHNSSAASAVRARIVGDVVVVLVGLGILVALSVGLLAKYLRPPSPVVTAPTSGDVATSTQAPPVPAVELPSRVTIEPEIAIFGSVGKLRLTALSDIPKRPSIGLSSDLCPSEETTPTSIPGVAAKAAGWDVIVDQRYADYQVVIVQAGSHWVDGQGCLGNGTSVLVFLDEKLQAVAYDTTKTLTDSSFVRAQPLSDRLMRLHAVSGALAELVLNPEVIQLRPLPEFDTACNGRVRVPRIERMNYLEARNRIMAEGWDPPRRNLDPQGAVLPIDEIGQCTGSGGCSVVFSHISGDSLTIPTLRAPSDTNEDGQIDASEAPKVGGFFVSCREDRGL